MVVILALGASAIYGVNDFIGGTLSRSIHPARILLVAQLATTVVLLPVVFGTHDWPVMGEFYFWAVLGGIANALAMGFFYTALARGTMGVVAPISAASVIVPVAGGLLSGETMHGALVVGVVMLIAGTVLAARQRTLAHQDRRPNRSVLLAVLAAFLFGISILSLGKGSLFSVTAILVITSAVSLVCYLLACVALRLSPLLNGRVLAIATATGVLGLVANWLLTTASAQGQIAIVAVLASLYPAVTALLARWLIKERLSRSQVLGSLIILVGIAIVALN